MTYVYSIIYTVIYAIKRFSFVKWLRRKTPQPGSQMDAALKYIRMRDHEVAAAAASGGPTSTPAAPAPVPIQPPPSPRPASQAQKGYDVSQIVF